SGHGEIDRQRGGPAAVQRCASSPRLAREPDRVARIAANRPARGCSRRSRSRLTGRPLNSRYVVGIDLGTTNCALAVRDASAPEDRAPIEVLQIAQLVNPGEVTPRPLLPSFLYVPGEMDFPA